MYDRKVFDRYLKEHEEKQLMKTVAQFKDIFARRDHAWMVLLRQTGIRVGTLAGLTVGDVKEALRTRRLTIRNEIAKKHNGYQIVVNQKAAAALRKLLFIRREMGHGPVPDEPLIMGRNHKRISVRSLQSRMQKWVLASGVLVAASPHWFRHTLAKRIIARSTSNDPREIVKRALGHKDINSSSVYTSPDVEDWELAMEQAS